MKVTVSKEAIVGALKQANAIAKGNSSFAILHDVLLTCVDDSFTVTATNFNQTIRISIPLDYDGEGIAEDGTALVKAEHFYKVVSSLFKGSLITIESVDGKVDVESGGFKCTVPSDDVSEFPDLSLDFTGTFERIEASLLRKGFNAVSKAISSYESRAEFTGAQFSIAKYSKELQLVSTDGHRLSYYHSKLDSECNGINPVLIPGYAIQCFLPCITDENVYVGTVSDKLLMRCGNIRLLTNLIAGQFPDFSKVIPQRFDMESTVDKKKLDSSIAIINNFTDKFGTVAFALGKEQVTLSAKEEKRGNGSVNVPATGEGTDMVVGMNSAYVKDAIATLDGDVAVFKAIDSESPVVVTSPDDDSVVQVIMPMQI